MDTRTIVNAVTAAYPRVQAIYLFGSYGTEDEWPNSDIDIALLLPPVEAKAAGSLALGELHLGRQRLLGRDVDLINLRRASTVLQKEVVVADRRIFCADAYAAEVVAADFEEPGDEDVFRKVSADLKAKGLSIGEDVIRQKMATLVAVANEQIAAEG